MTISTGSARRSQEQRQNQRRQSLIGLLERQRINNRINILNSSLPDFTADPTVMVGLATSELDDEAMVQAAISTAGESFLLDQKEIFDELPPDFAEARFNLMSSGMQTTMRGVGYKPQSEIDAEGPSWYQSVDNYIQGDFRIPLIGRHGAIGNWMLRNADPTGIIDDGPFPTTDPTIGGTIGSSLSGASLAPRLPFLATKTAVHGIFWGFGATERYMKRIHRTGSVLSDRNTFKGLDETGNPIYSSITGGLPDFPLLGEIATFPGEAIASLAAGHPERIKDAWDFANKGEETFQKGALHQVARLLSQNPEQFTIPGSDLWLAKKLASGLNEVSILEELGIPTDDPEYLPTVQRIYEKLEQTTFKQSLDILEDAKFSYGREAARNLGIDPNHGFGTVFSGTADALFIVIVDPINLVGGAAIKTRKARRWRISTDGAEHAETINKYQRMAAHERNMSKGVDDVAKEGDVAVPLSPLDYIAEKAAEKLPKAGDDLSIEELAEQTQLRKHLKNLDETIADRELKLSELPPGSEQTAGLELSIEMATENRHRLVALINDTLPEGAEFSQAKRAALNQDKRKIEEELAIAYEDVAQLEARLERAEEGSKVLFSNLDDGTGALTKSQRIESKVWLSEATIEARLLERDLKEVNKKLAPMLKAEKEAKEATRISDEAAKADQEFIQGLSKSDLNQAHKTNNWIDRINAGFKAINAAKKGFDRDVLLGQFLDENPALENVFDNMYDWHKTVTNAGDEGLESVNGVWNYLRQERGRQAITKTKLGGVRSDLRTIPQHTTGTDVVMSVKQFGRRALDPSKKRWADEAREFQFVTDMSDTIRKIDEAVEAGTFEAEYGTLYEQLRSVVARYTINGEPVSHDIDELLNWRLRGASTSGATRRIIRSLFIHANTSNKLPLTDSMTIKAFRQFAEAGSLVHMSQKQINGWIGKFTFGNEAERAIVLQQFWMDIQYRAGIFNAADQATDTFFHRVATRQNQIFSLGARDEAINQGIRTKVAITAASQGDDVIMLPTFREVARAVIHLNIHRMIFETFNPNWVDRFIKYIWAPAQLMRIGFIPRASGEELLAYALRRTPAELIRSKAAVSASDLRRRRDGTVVPHEEARQLTILRPVLFVRDTIGQWGGVRGSAKGGVYTSFDRQAHVAAMADENWPNLTNEGKEALVKLKGEQIRTNRPIRVALSNWEGMQTFSSGAADAMVAFFANKPFIPSKREVAVWLSNWGSKEVTSPTLLALGLNTTGDIRRFAADLMLTDPRMSRGFADFLGASYSPYHNVTDDVQRGKRAIGSIASTQEAKILPVRADVSKFKNYDRQNDAKEFLVNFAAILDRFRVDPFMMAGVRVLDQYVSTGSARRLQANFGGRLYHDDYDGIKDPRHEVEVLRKMWDDVTEEQRRTIQQLVDGDITIDTARKLLPDLREREVHTLKQTRELRDVAIDNFVDGRMDIEQARLLIPEAAEYVEVLGKFPISVRQTMHDVLMHRDVFGKTGSTLNRDSLLGHFLTADVVDRHGRYLIYRFVQDRHVTMWVKAGDVERRIVKQYIDGALTAAEASEQAPKLKELITAFKDSSVGVEAVGGKSNAARMFEAFNESPYSTFSSDLKNFDSLKAALKEKGTDPYKVRNQLHQITMNKRGVLDGKLTHFTWEQIRAQRHFLNKILTGIDEQTLKNREFRLITEHGFGAPVIQTMEELRSQMLLALETALRQADSPAFTRSLRTVLEEGGSLQRSPSLGHHFVYTPMIPTEELIFLRDATPQQYSAFRRTLENELLKIGYETQPARKIVGQIFGDGGSLKNMEEITEYRRTHHPDPSDTSPLTQFAHSDSRVAQAIDNAWAEAFNIRRLGVRPYRVGMSEVPQRKLTALELAEAGIEAVVGGGVRLHRRRMMASQFDVLKHDDTKTMLVLERKSDSIGWQADYGPEFGAHSDTYGREGDEVYVTNRETLTRGRAPGHPDAAAQIEKARLELEALGPDDLVTVYHITDAESAQIMIRDRVISVPEHTPGGRRMLPYAHVSITHEEALAHGKVGPREGPVGWRKSDITSGTRDTVVSFVVPKKQLRTRTASRRTYRTVEGKRVYTDRVEIRDVSDVFMSTPARHQVRGEVTDMGRVSIPVGEKIKQPRISDAATRATERRTVAVTEVRGYENRIGPEKLFEDAWHADDLNYEKGLDDIGAEEIGEARRQFDELDPEDLVTVYIRVPESKAEQFKEEMLKRDTFSPNMKQAVFMTPKDAAKEGYTVFGAAVQKQDIQAITGAPFHHTQEADRILRTTGDSRLGDASEDIPGTLGGDLFSRTADAWISWRSPIQVREPTGKPHIQPYIREVYESPEIDDWSNWRIVDKIIGDGTPYDRAITKMAELQVEEILDTLSTVRRGNDEVFTELTAPLVADDMERLSPQAIMENAVMDELPQHAYGPTLLGPEQYTPGNIWEAMKRGMFDDIISPAVGSLSRQAPFVENLARAIERNAHILDTMGPSTPLIKGFHEAIALLTKEGTFVPNVDEIIMRLWDMDSTDFALVLDREGDALTIEFLKLIRKQDPKKLRIWAEETLGVKMKLQNAQELTDYIHQRRRAYEVMRDSSFDETMTLTTPFIDDHRVRSQFQTHMSGIVPFWFAEEQFLKRWARGLYENPIMFRKAQLTVSGFRNMGFIQKDQYGNDVFVWPMSETVSTYAAEVASISGMFGVPAMGVYSTPLSTNLDFILPGVSSESPQGFQYGPGFSFQMNFIARLFPEFSDVRDNLLGDMSSNKLDPGNQSTDGTFGVIYDMVAPSYLKNGVRAIVGNNSTQLASAQAQALQYLVANGYAPDEKDAMDIERFLDQSRNTARVILGMRSLTSFTGGVASNPFYDGEAGETFRRLLSEAEIDYIDAVDLVVSKYGGDATAYTVFGTESQSGAPIPSTRASLEFMQANSQFLQNFEMAGAWFLPQTRPSGEYGIAENRARNQSLAHELRITRTPEDMLRSMYVAAASEDFYTSQDVYQTQRLTLKASDGSPELLRLLDAQWRRWRKAYMLQHPVFNEEISTPTGQKRRDKTLAQMRLLVANPNIVPEVDHKPQLIEFMEGLVSYQDAIDSLSGETSGIASDIRHLWRTQFFNQSQQFVQKYPELSVFYNSIIRPQIGISQITKIEFANGA